MSLAQKCVMAILGESGYGYLLKQHMCCGFPLAPRDNTLPRRCVCPPMVTVKQNDYGCKEGNKLHCNERADWGGSLMKPLNDSKNNLGARFSFTKDAYRDNPTVWYRPFEIQSSEKTLSEWKKIMKESDELRNLIKEGLQLQCTYNQNIIRKVKYCSSIK